MATDSRAPRSPAVCGVHKQRNIAIHLEYFTYLHCVYQLVTHDRGCHLQGQSVCVCVWGGGGGGGGGAIGL